MSGFTLTLAFPALAHEPKRHDHGATSEKHHYQHRERTKVRVRPLYTAVDVDTKRRRLKLEQTEREKCNVKHSLQSSYWPALSLWAPNRHWHNSMVTAEVACPARAKE
jgi:hypothetical protein